MEKPRFPGNVESLLAFAREAGEVLLQMQGGALAARKKAPAELVTSADHESHRMLSQRLGSAFPSVPLVMEEQDNDEVVPETCITEGLSLLADAALPVDELDGTNIYAHGCSEWGLSLAFMERCEPVAGILHQPALGSTVVAWRGGGTWLDGRRIRLDQKLRLADGISLIEFNAHLRRGEFLWMQEIATASLATRALASAVGNAMELLRGRGALFANCRGGKVWDFSAAALAVEEAGGCVLRPDGGEMDWTRLRTGALMAANQGIMGDLIAMRTPGGRVRS